MSSILNQLKSQLIVSCQAPPDSPLHQSEIIAAIAAAVVAQGAAAVRIDTPAHIQAVRQRLPHIPIIGLWKQTQLDSEVYITPRFQDAVAVAEAGADIIAIDATRRQRPDNQSLPELIAKIKQQLQKPIMADIDTLENGIEAIDAGAEIVGTTLYGYTRATKNCQPPGFDLLAQLVPLPVFTICEGGIATPAAAAEALDLGADAVVVGTAITGVDLLAKAFYQAISKQNL